MAKKCLLVVPTAFFNTWERSSFKVAPSSTRYVFANLVLYVSFPRLRYRHKKGQSWRQQFPTFFPPTVFSSSLYPITLLRSSKEDLFSVFQLKARQPTSSSHVPFRSSCLPSSSFSLQAKRSLFLPACCALRLLALGETPDGGGGRGGPPDIPGDAQGKEGRKKLGGEEAVYRCTVHRRRPSAMPSTKMQSGRKRGGGGGRLWDTVWHTRSESTTSKGGGEIPFFAALRGSA